MIIALFLFLLQTVKKTPKPARDLFLNYSVCVVGWEEVGWFVVGADNGLRKTVTAPPQDTFEVTSPEVPMRLISIF